MNLRAAAQQAFEAWSRPNGINYVDFRPYMEALRTSLAEPEQEPVAWMRPDNRVAEESTVGAQFRRGPNRPPIGTWVPLYTHPVDDTALLRQALEALEARRVNDYFVEHIYAAITALRERLGEKK